MNDVVWFVYERTGGGKVYRRGPYRSKRWAHFIGLVWETIHAGSEVKIVEMEKISE